MELDMYIDKRPIDEIINASKIYPQYEFIVNDILRDRDYGWTLDYYKGDNTTSYDVIIGRTKMEINDYNKYIVENKLSIDKARDLIDKNKKLKKNEIDDLNKKIENAIDSINDFNNLIKKNESLLEEYKWLQFVELHKERHLRMIRNKFKMNRNLEYLRKGVSWICSYTDKLRGIPVDESYVLKEDNSAW